MDFKRFKDRTWGVYTFCAGSLAAAPAAIGRAGFAAFGQLLWLAYVAPGSPLKRTMSAFATTIGAQSPARLFAGFSRGLVLGLYRMERLRLGQEAEIDAALEIPELDRLKVLVQGRGAVLVMPHTHGSLPMVRGLSRHFRVLMIVRSTRDKTRSASQHTYYDRMGCNVLDVRRESESSVARAVIRALRQGQIVVGTGDLIRKPPPSDAPFDKTKDLVRAEAFGQPLGAPGWPARFALKAGAPLLPVMIEQAKDRIVLHLGPVAEGDDIISFTQSWVGALEIFLRSHPSDWTFVFDRRWSALLQAAAATRRI